MSVFLDFFEQELFPYVDEHYRTLPYRVFSGHSFGGLFALNAFFSRPEMYRAVISISPVLNWDEDLPLRQAKRFLSDRSEVKATLFVAMANEEEGQPKPNYLDRFEEILKGTQAKDFNWEVKRITDESHNSVVLRAQYWGLKKIFGDWSPPRDAETGAFIGGIDGLKKHYEVLSERFGFPIIPAELQVNAIGYQSLFADDLATAIKIFRYNLSLYPESPNVYDSLAEALAKAGKSEEALINYTKAVETAERVGDPRLKIFKANRNLFVKEHRGSDPQ